MIEVEIIKSPDQNVLGKFRYFQNQIYIGKDQGHILINDYHLKDSHLMIEVIGSDLIIHPQKSVDHYLIDGKRSSTVRKINHGQCITIGTTDLKINTFEETLFKSKKNILDEKLNTLISTNSTKLQIIEQVSKLVKLPC